MSNAIESQGTLIQISTDGGSPASYVTLGEVVSYTAFDGQAAEIDTTHLRSTGKEFLMGLQDFGQVNYQANYLSTDAGQVMARAAKASRAKHYFKMTQSDSKYVTFEGFVLSAPMSAGVDAKVDTSFAVRVTGTPVFSA